MKNPFVLNSAELEALFEPPHANARTVMKPIVPVDDDGNPGVGITMNSETRKSGLLVVVQGASVEVRKPDDSSFSAFVMRRGEDQRKKKVHITSPAAPSLTLQRDSRGTLLPVEMSGIEIVDEQGFIDFWEKVAFCARQGVNIEKILPL